MRLNADALRFSLMRFPLPAILSLLHTVIENEAKANTTGRIYFKFVFIFSDNSCGQCLVKSEFCNWNIY